MLRSATMAASLAGAVLAGLAGPAGAQDEAEVATTDHQDWQVRCPAEAECAAVHRADSVYIAVRENPQGDGLSVMFIVHPETKVGAPVGIRLASGWEAQFKVARCGPNFCEAPIAPDSAEAVVEHLKEDTGGIVAYPVAGEIAITEFSLMGFSEAVADLSR